jgi:hypothetical protein
MATCSKVRRTLRSMSGLEAHWLKPPQVDDFGFPQENATCSAELLKMAAVLM